MRVLSTKEAETIPHFELDKISVNIFFLPETTGSTNDLILVFLYKRKDIKQKSAKCISKIATLSLVKNCFFILYDSYDWFAFRAREWDWRILLQGERQAEDIQLTAHRGKQAIIVMFFKLTKFVLLNI